MESAAQSPCPFFRLPREIRDEIYSYLLVAPHNIAIPLSIRTRNNAPSTICIKRHPHFHNHVNSDILLVCRRINTETTALLYPKNIFDLQDKSVEFLEAIGEKNRKLLRCIMIHWRPFGESYTSTTFRKTIGEIARLRDSLTFVQISVDVPASYCMVRCLQRIVKAYGFRFKLNGEWVNNFRGRRAPVAHFVFATGNHGDWKQFVRGQYAPLLNIFLFFI